MAVRADSAAMTHAFPLRAATAVTAVVLLGGCAGRPAPVTVAPSLGLDPASMERMPSGLLIRTDREGQGLAAGVGDTVVVHYTGWLTDATVIDSSRERGEPLAAVLGPGGRLVPGWDEGIRGMRPGGRRTLLIPPELGYGQAGGGEVIPPNAWLVFEVELIELR